MHNSVKNWEKILASLAAEKFLFLGRKNLIIPRSCYSLPPLLVMSLKYLELHGSRGLSVLSGKQSSVKG